MKHISIVCSIKRVFIMSNTEFKCDELDEFTEKMFYKLCEQYPKKAENLMKNALNSCKEEVIVRTPRSVKKPKKYRRSKHLQDNWKTINFKKPGKTFGVLKNSSPHAHLIEYGHVTQNGGFVEGVHMLENTMTHQQPKIDKDIEALVDSTFDIK